MNNQELNNRISAVIIADDLLCSGKYCSIKNGCVRFLKTRFSTLTLKDLKLCSIEGQEYLNYFVPIEPLDHFSEDDDFVEDTCFTDIEEPPPPWLYDT